MVLDFRIIINAAAESTMNNQYHSCRSAAASFCLPLKCMLLDLVGGFKDFTQLLDDQLTQNVSIVPW